MVVSGTKNKRLQVVKLQKFERGLQKRLIFPVAACTTGSLRPLGENYPLQHKKSLFLSGLAAAIFRNHVIGGDFEIKTFKILQESQHEAEISKA